MFVRRLAFLSALALASAPGTAQAQDFIPQAELEVILRENVLCYYPSERFSCLWAELYMGFAPDHTILFSGQANFDEGLTALEFRLEWQDDGLCIDDATQGLMAVFRADGFRFPFDLTKLEDVTETRFEDTLAELQEFTQPNSCFRYSLDPETPGQILQHVFYDGVEQAETDPVALIPRFSSGVPLDPT